MALQASGDSQVLHRGKFRVLPQESRGNPAPAGALFLVALPEHVFPVALQVVDAYP